MNKKRDTPAENQKKKLSEETDKQIYHLRLFVTGTTPRSVKAIANIKKICEEHLKGRYDLEVIDLYLQPELARSEQIIAAPTLIKKMPYPLRRIIGDLSVEGQVLARLDIQEIKKETDKHSVDNANNKIF